MGLLSWRKKWLECDEKLRPKIIVSSLKKCSKDRYPKSSVLLKLAAILPVILCECTFYVLQHLGTWFRAFMTTERFSFLAVVNIHRGVQNDCKRAVKVLLELHLRKLNVSNLISEEE